MIVRSSAKSIRQIYPGLFRRPEDGQEPYAHVSDTKVESAKAQKSRALYLRDEKVVTFKKDPSKSDFPVLFDPDAGARFTADRVARTKEKNLPEEQYDNTGKKKTLNKHSSSLVNDWA